MKYVVTALLLILMNVAIADENMIALEKVKIDLHDTKSIERGAKFFAANCMACHTLVYLRYDKLAQKAGITYEKMPVNVKAWPFGITPPDLSLEESVRGANWIYTYLHSFYLDPARPTGFNNLLVQNTVMPGILAPYQGQQVLIKDPGKLGPIFAKQQQWYDRVELQSAGSMSPEAFDATITDVVNFLGYAAEPFHESQVYLGYWVIGFLLILFVLAYFLKKEYWRDIKKKD